MGRIKPTWGRRAGRRGKGRGTMYTQPFHHSAGRWMVFGDGCPDAPARCRETSERSGLRRRSPQPPRPCLDCRIKWGPGGGCSSGAAAAATELLRGPAPAVTAPRGERAPRASRRDHARPRAAARPAGAGPLPSAPGTGRSRAGGGRHRAGQDVPARQPLGGG